MKNVIVWILLLCVRISYAHFSYDLATYDAQQGNWKQAKEKLSKAIVDAHDKVDLLYDTGVASYQLGDFTQAKAYFCQAAACEDISTALKEQAYFNSGNTCVALNELESAIEQYEKVLVINSHNKYAQHNLEQVKQMLEQQKQQQQQKQNQQDDQQNDSSEQNQQENNSDDSNGQDQEQGDDNQSNNNNNNQDTENDDNASQDGQHQERKTESGADGKEREDKGDKQRQSDEAENNKKRDNENEPKKKSDNTQTQQQQNNVNNHNTTPEKDESTSPNSQDKESNEKKQSMAAQDGVNSEAQKDISDKLQDPWLAKVLQEQEERDRQVNKQLMEARIRDQFAGKDGQNCW